MPHDRPHDSHQEGLLRHPRPDPGRDPGRHQAGLPAAGPPAPPRHQPGKDAARRFREITEAYDLLSDPARRTAYDRTRPPVPGPLATVEDPAVVSRLLAVLEDAWTAIRRQHPQIPPVVIIIASGSNGRQRLYGHHAPQRWHAAGADRTEIMISGEGLARDAASVLGTPAARGRARPGRSTADQGHQPPGPLPQPEIQGARRRTRHHRRTRPPARLVHHHVPDDHRTRATPSRSPPWPRP